MKHINYIDLGVHNGQEIDLFLEQFKNVEDYKINIYGLEANKYLCDELTEKYKNIKNIKMFNCAINEKNESTKLYIANNEGLGSSVFSTKNNVQPLYIISCGSWA